MNVPVGCITIVTGPDVPSLCVICHGVGSSRFMYGGGSMEGLRLGIGGKYNSHAFFMYLIQNNRFASLGSGEAQIIDNNDKI